jgi:hypothetical protein
LPKSFRMISRHKNLYKLIIALSIILFLSQIYLLNSVIRDSNPPREAYSRPNRQASKMLGIERDAFIQQAQSEDYIFDTVLPNNAISGAVIITISNYGYKNMTLNWIASLLRTGHTKFVVFCYDTDLLISLAEIGFRANVALVPTSWLEFSLTKNVYNENIKQEFDQMMQSRVAVWYQIALRDRSFLFSDADLVFLSEHVLENVLFNYKNSVADIIFSVGRPIPRFIIYNTGFFYATPTEFVKSLFKQLLDEAKKITDQQALNDMIYKGVYREKKIPIDYLDRFLYACSTLYFVEKMNDKHQIEPLIVHASQRPYKLKIDFLKARNFWFLDQNGDLSF